MNNNKFLGAIFLSGAASIWGGMYVVSKFVLEFIPPLTLVWLRYIVAFVTLFAVLKFSEKKSGKVKITKRDWKQIFLIAFVGYFISIAFQFAGTKLSDAHTGSLITSATPAFLVIFARIILKEKLTLRKVIALVLSTIGIVVVVGTGGQHSDTYITGSLMLIVAATTWALLSIFVKIASRNIPILVITTYAVLLALLMMTPFMLFELITTKLVLSNSYIIPGILYLGVVATALAFFLWNKGVEMMDAGVGSLFFFFQPISGSLLGYLILKETLTMNFFAGAFLILLGVFFVIRE